VRIFWTEPALKDLDEIFAYIAQDRPGVAAEVVLEVIDRVETLLAVSPKLGRLSRFQNLRCWTLGRYPYTVFYRLGDQQLDVLRVLHNRRNFSAIFTE